MHSRKRRQKKLQSAKSVRQRVQKKSAILKQQQMECRVLLNVDDVPLKYRIASSCNIPKKRAKESSTIKVPDTVNKKSAIKKPKMECRVLMIDDVPLISHKSSSRNTTKTKTRASLPAVKNISSILEESHDDASSASSTLLSSTDNASASPKFNMVAESSSDDSSASSKINMVATHCNRLQSSSDDSSASSKTEMVSTHCNRLTRRSLTNSSKLQSSSDDSSASPKINMVETHCNRLQSSSDDSSASSKTDTVATRCNRSTRRSSINRPKLRYSSDDSSHGSRAKCNASLSSDIPLRTFTDCDSSVASSDGLPVSSYSCNSATYSSDYSSSNYGSTKQQRAKQAASATKHISKYELQREKNMKEHLEFLDSLNIMGAKKDLLLSYLSTPRKKLTKKPKKLIRSHPQWTNGRLRRGYRVLYLDDSDTS